MTARPSRKQGAEQTQARAEALPVRPEGCEMYIAGIGASAGGLEALEALFRNMPPDTGMAFVVVLHLSPDFKSHMEELLARQTDMPVFQVEDGMEVKPNTIHLIPPKKEMIISEGRLLLTEKGPERTFTHPIDQFFRSLASDAGRYSIGVILSGTGSDGSRGVRAIHEAGGLVVVQSEATAKFDGMPLNAQATGAVDLVLAPDAIPDALARYVRGTSPALLGQEELPAVEARGIEKIVQLLRGECGVDFSHYKAGTVARRVHRRLSLHQDGGLDEYVARLEGDKEELEALHRDLLIGVTSFFRDGEAFELLEKEIIPGILAGTGPDDTIRVWTAGCATGEEAYSLAMLFHEQLGQGPRRAQVKMFATDVHRASLEKAASGVYSEASLADLPPARRSRYFREDRDGYHVVPELRQMVVFAPHNVLVDAPFTQLDLVVCRNMLIYLQPAAQKKVLSLFHFGLKTGGVLFLGPSETPGEIAEEFQAIDKRWKIYRKRRDARLPADVRLVLPGGTAALPAGPRRTERWRGGPVDGQLLGTYDRLLEEHMPPSFLVDDGFQLLHTFGGGDRYLRHRTGRPSYQLLDLLVGDLRTSVGGALSHALKENKTVRYNGIRAALPEGARELRVVVQPLQDGHTRQTQLLVKIEELGGGTPPPGVDADVSLEQISREHIRTLEADLRFTRENLQATIEELETANEELQAANEELVASNEELQSTNEELHSVNEELYTVNAEHQRKIEELTELTDDMNNLLAITRVGVIFLDRDMRIRRFTPEIARAFNLLPHDIGRRIDIFTPSLEYRSLIEDVQRVFREGAPLEREIRDRSGVEYLLRLLPYQTSTSIEGVVLTLIDISSLKQTEADLRLFKFISDRAEDVHLVISAEGRLLYANRAMTEQLGYTEAEAATLLLHDVAPEVPSGRLEEILEEARRGAGHVPLWETVLRARDGARYPAEVSVSLIELGGAPALYASFRDITERKKAESRLATEHAVTQVAAEESSLRAAVPRVLDVFLGHLEVDVAEYWTPDGDGATLGLYARRVAEGSGGLLPWQEASRALTFRAGQGLVGKVYHGQEPAWIGDVAAEEGFPCREAALRAGLRSAMAFPVRSGTQTVGVICLFTRRAFVPDAAFRTMMAVIGAEVGLLTRRLRSEEALRLRDRAISSAPNGIVIADARATDCPILYVNEGFQKITGYEESEVLGRNCRFLQGEGTDPRTVTEMHRAIAEERPCQVTMLNYRKDGVPFWNRLHISPVRSEEGEVTHFVGIQHDITDQKRIEEALWIAQQTAESASRAKSDFLTRMSHELRTPLNAIIGMSKMLRTRRFGPLNEKQADYISDVVKAGEHLLGLINDILDLSRVEAGRLDLRPEAFALHDEVQATLTTVQTLADEKGTQLLADPPRDDAAITQDRGRFRQVLLNLLSNAFKFTPSGGRVTVRWRWVTEVTPLAKEVPAGEARAFCVEVEDTGSGIPSEEQPRIWEEFHQVKRGERPCREGTGLGLPLCRRLVRAMGGNIWLDSHPGLGSRFWFILPRELPSPP